MHGQQNINLDIVVKAATEKLLRIWKGTMCHLAPDILRSTSTVLVIIWTIRVATKVNQTPKTENDYCSLYKMANKSVNKKHPLELMELFRFKPVTIVTN